MKNLWRRHTVSVPTVTQHTYHGFMAANGIAAGVITRTAAMRSGCIHETASGFKSCIGFFDSLWHSGENYWYSTNSRKTGMISSENHETLKERNYTGFELILINLILIATNHIQYSLQQLSELFACSFWACMGFPLIYPGHPGSFHMTLYVCGKPERKHETNLSIKTWSYHMIPFCMYLSYLFGMHSVYFTRSVFHFACVSSALTLHSMQHCYICATM